MSETLVYQPSQTTHWRNLFANKSALLGSHNLNQGEELVAHINYVNIEKIKNKDGKDETVPVLHFHNAPPMVLNITNTKMIASLYGNNYDQWAGKYIQIYATPIKAFGQVQDALRIRPKQPVVAEDLSQYESSLNACKNLDELQKTFMSLPKHIKPKMTQLKNQLKSSLGGNQ